MRTACLGVLLTLCALGLAPPARAFDVAEIGRAEMLAEVPGGAPVEGEMVRLRLRAIFKGRIALAELRQPALTNVSWSQLGRDATLEEQFHGFTVPGVERDLALFPQRSGTVTIPPFVLHMTVIDDGGERVEADLVSEPLTLTVGPKPVAIEPGQAWLPASALTVTDAWDRSPAALKQDEVAHRRLTIEARGLTADRLPRPPRLREPGVIAFAYPVERTTEVSDGALLARAVYQWDVKPVSHDAAELPAIEIPWFDTQARQMRVAATAPVTVKMLLAGTVARAGPERRGASPLALAGIAAGAAVWSFAIAVLWSRLRPRRLLLARF